MPRTPSNFLSNSQNSKPSISTNHFSFQQHSKKRKISYINNELTQWLINNGASINSVEAFYTPYNTIGIRAKENISAKDKLIILPSIQLTLRSSNASSISSLAAKIQQHYAKHLKTLDGRILLAITLLNFEQDFIGNSWDEYFMTFPSFNEMQELPLVKYYNDPSTDFNNLYQEKSGGIAAATNINDILQHKIIELEEIYKDLKLFFTPASQFDFLDFVCSYAFVKSRNFGDYKSSKINPFMDLVNHSRQANILIQQDTELNRSIMWATRKIYKGEEILFDYTFKDDTAGYFLYGIPPVAGIDNKPSLKKAPIKHKKQYFSFTKNTEARNLELLNTELPEWIREQGGIVNQHLEIYQNSYNTLGIKTNHELEKNTILIALPDNLNINIENSLNSNQLAQLILVKHPQLANDQILLLAVIMLTCDKEINSTNWANYFSSIPSYSELSLLPIVKYALDKNFDFAADYTKTSGYHNSRNINTKLSEKYQHLTECYHKINKLETSIKFKLIDFVTAYAFVESRNFGDETSRKLSPMMDLCNHSKNANAETGYAVDMNMFMLRAKSSIKAQQEILFDYGLDNPFMYYFFHGFVPKHTPHNFSLKSKKRAKK